MENKFVGWAALTQLVTEIKTRIAGRIASSEKGASNGVATLDATGRVPYTQLPESAMEFKGGWDASTNNPELKDGTGTNGDFYVCNVAGTVNFGTAVSPREVTFYNNDRALYDGTNHQWIRLPASEVRSVNGMSGDVVLNIPAAQVNSDWNASSGVAQILNKPSLATVATSGSYNDLSNKPTIPAAQVNSDWNATTGVAQILNKPSLATVATSGSYTDLSNKPTIPAAQVNSDWNATTGVAKILNKPSLATVATSGSYNDLSNKPTIPAAQVNSDWNATTGVAQILNKPSLATVATSGSYTDLSNKPTIPAAQVNSDWNATTGVAKILNKPSLLQIGTTATTAAAGNHTHTLSLASDTGTSALTLAASTKYKLTAGGSSFIFTTPPNTTYSSKAAASGGTAVSLVTTGEKYTWNNKSSLTIGTTATTAAAGNHTHTLSLATSTDTNQLTLAASTKYKLTAGGNTYVFTTPPNTTYSTVSKTAAGLCPQLPNETTTTKFLRQDGSWQVPASTVTGVKGNSESSYRTGNVNITKANIGLGNVDNTADANKSVAYATTALGATKATSPDIYTCSTASGTAAKVVSGTPSNFTLFNNLKILVYFSNNNTANSPTLNVGNTGATAIMLGAASYNTTSYSTPSTTAGTWNYLRAGLYEATYNSYNDIWILIRIAVATSAGILTSGSTCAIRNYYLDMTHGYIHFSNGMLIQWGKYAPSSSNQTFPIAYSTVPLVFSNYNNNNQNRNYSPVCTYVSATQFALRSESDYSSSDRFAWIAIGYLTI